MGRGLVSQTIRRFRGLNVFSTFTSTTPDQATDLINVIPSNSGGLEKLRVPRILTPAPNTGGCPVDQPILSVPYSFTITPTGGIAPYSFELVSGSFPAGLSLSGAVISGTPTAQTVNPWVVKVSDARGNFSLLSCTFTVSAIPVNLATLIQFKILGDAVNRTFDTNVAVGNTIIVAFNYQQPTPHPTVSDNLGNVYTKLGEFIGGAGCTDITIWAAPVTHAGSCTVSIGSTGVAPFQLCIAEFSGVDTGIILDGTQNTSGVGPLGQTTSITTTIPTVLMIAVNGSAEFGAIYAVNAPFTLIAATTGAIGVAFYAPVTSGAKTVVFTGGRSDTNNQTAMVALKANHA